MTVSGGKLVMLASAGMEKEGPMQTIKEAAADFLSHHRIAVTGVSRTPQSHGSNVVYRRLRQRGYKVFPVNPNAEEVEGDPCYRDLKSVPGGVDAVVIGTRSETAGETIRECVDLGIKYVWMHRAIGKGSVSEAAAEYGRHRGLSVIDGGCPLMFEPTADGAHKVMRFIFTMTGKVPRICDNGSTQIEAFPEAMGRRSG
jgi:predicted CoA-binding protein